MNAYSLTTCQVEKVKTENIYSTWKLYLELYTVQYWEHYYAIFMADLFFIISNIEIASYVDDNTPYIAADNIDDLIKSLEEA